jgi:hypothetical protein
MKKSDSVKIENERTMICAAESGGLGCGWLGTVCQARSANFGCGGAGAGHRKRGGVVEGGNWLVGCVVWYAKEERRSETQLIKYVPGSTEQKCVCVAFREYLYFFRIFGVGCNSRDWFVRSGWWGGG